MEFLVLTESFHSISGDRLQYMNIIEFSTIIYWIKCYVAWPWKQHMSTSSGLVADFGQNCFIVDEYDAYIIVSFVNATLVLSIGETVEEVTDSGFLGTTPTLSCSQLGDDALVQVRLGTSDIRFGIGFVCRENKKPKPTRYD